MKAFAKKFLANIWILSVIQIFDLIEITKKIINMMTHTIFLTVPFDSYWWYNFFVKLILGIVVVALSKKYFKMSDLYIQMDERYTQMDERYTQMNERYTQMKKHQLLSQRFAMIIIQEQYNLNNILTDKRDRIQSEFKEKLLEAAKAEWGEELTEPEIKKLVNAFFAPE